MKMLKVFSRQLLGLGLFLGGSFMLNAQADLAMANIDEAIPAIKIDAHNAYSMDHTREALGQVSQHISDHIEYCLLYTSPSPRDRTRSRMPSSA